MILLPAAIYVHQRLIHLHIRALLKRLQDSGHLIYIHHAAGAGTALIVMELHSSEHSSMAFLRHRKCLILIQQENLSLCHCLTCLLGVLFKIQNSATHVPLLDKPTVNLLCTYHIPCLIVNLFIMEQFSSVCFCYFPDHRTFSCITAIFQYSLQHLQNTHFSYQKLNPSVQWQSLILRDLELLYEKNTDTLQPFIILEKTVHIFRLLAENMNCFPDYDKDTEDILSLTAMIGYVQKNYANKILLKDIFSSGNCCKTKCTSLFQKYLITMQRRGGFAATADKRYLLLQGFSFAQVASSLRHRSQASSKAAAPAHRL